MAKEKRWSKKSNFAVIQIRDIILTYISKIGSENG